MINRTPYMRPVIKIICTPPENTKKVQKLWKKIYLQAGGYKYFST